MYIYVFCLRAQENVLHYEYLVRQFFSILHSLLSSCQAADTQVDFGIPACFSYSLTLLVVFDNYVGGMLDLAKNDYALSL